MPKNDQHALLRKELEATLKSFGIQAKDLLNSDQFLHEFEFAIRSEEHEGRIPPYGVVFTHDIQRLSPEAILTVPSEGIARGVSDGINSFVAFENDHLVGVVLGSTKDEKAIVDWSSNSNATVIVRRSDGTVKLFLAYQGVLAHRNRNWQYRPHLYWIIRDFPYVYAEVDKESLATVLNFAVHRLSPRQIGATLVWCLKPPTLEELRSMTPTQDLSALKLNLDNPKHSAIVENLLSQTDGATLLSPDVAVIGMGAHLHYSDKSKAYIPEHRGTRHTSAQRFSYDYDNGLLVTVSSDGPVTIFSDGVRVAAMRSYSASDYADNLTRLVPSKRDDIEVNSHIAVCPTCGKTSVVEEVLIRGMRMPETAECPICDTEIMRKNSWDLKAHVVKKLR